MNGTSSQAHASRSDVDIAEILRLLWVKKFLIITVIVACLLTASLYLHSATYQYTAQLKLTPTESSAGSGLTSRLGALGGLASVAGINLNSGEALSPFQLYVESISSLEVAQELLTDQTIVTTLFKDEWNSNTSSWQDPSGSLKAVVNVIKAMIGAPIYPWRAPDAQRLQEYIEANVVIEENSKKAIVTISYQHPDPKFATHLLSAIDTATDRVLRQKTLVRAHEYIAFLTEKLTSTSIAEHRMDIAEALSDQEKLVIYASSSSPFAAQPFGKASSSARATKPRPVLVLALAISFGIFAGSIMALIIEGTKRRSEATPAIHSN